MNKSTLAFLLIALLAAGYWYWSRRPNLSAGDMALDFSATLADGRNVHLSDLKGQYVLLQFWGSWCGPCRAENPHLVDLYRKYHDKGFEIFSIGLERDERAWKRAIQQDGLPWSWQTLGLNDFDHPVARLYNVKSIPMTFLINRDGKVVGVDLDPRVLDKMLGEALGGS
ncbi:MAG TPA: TlpA disulfide reductase family protein [Saprospiraceae bacterium]|nr:TlpA disulfide reductase family protein [Saprospiraceae bacterium]HNL38188.1 TlpA disulfide reductase family protein [Saprospiraceae bacterium]HNM23808.1 TlpA disulfide reductase family protein [Saprospiraceae bacterium]